MKITKWVNTERYAAQSGMVRQALATPEHALDGLLELMRHTGEAAVYLSGSRLDNDYCFGSQDVGVLLSVLPEDAQKAAEPGYHPGSIEVYVTFQYGMPRKRASPGDDRQSALRTHSSAGTMSPGALRWRAAGRFHHYQNEPQLQTRRRQV